METCTHCSNTATRNAYNPHSEKSESLCEVHYAYLKPELANVNPMEIGRCIRCGERALNKEGTKERLIEHHINYPLDVTVPVCDSCHAEIHSGQDCSYLERYERGTSPYEPVGSSNAKGVAVNKKYRSEPATGETCPECGVETIRPPDGMEFDEPFLCPNGDCRRTSLSFRECQK
jgi:predicted RNA-binding Zn-ribbon protein involved in translation (DUF1610 family)